MSVISQNIRYLRRLNGLTQEQFSQKIGIKRSLLGAYEESRAMPNLANMMNITKVFNITMEQLISTDLRKTDALKPQFETVTGFIEEDFMEDETLDNQEFEQNTDLDAELPFEQEFEQHLNDATAQIPTEVFEKTPMPSKQTFDDIFSIPTASTKVNTENTTTEPVSKAKQIKNTIEPQPTQKEPDFQQNDFPTLENGLFSVTHNVPTITTPDGNIPLIQQSNLISYLAHYEEDSFVKQLPKIQLSLLSKNKEHRAFEMDKNFPLARTILVGEYVKNWFALNENDKYLFLTQKQGLLYGKPENKLKTHGFLLVSNSERETKIMPKEIFEVWRIVLMISTDIL